MDGRVEFSCTICSIAFSTKYMVPLHHAVDHGSMPLAVVNDAMEQIVVNDKSVRLHKTIVHVLAKEACGLKPDRAYEGLRLKSYRLLEQLDKTESEPNRIARLLAESYGLRQGLLDVLAEYDIQRKDYVQQALFHDDAVVVQVLRNLVYSAAGREAILGLKNHVYECENMLNLMDKVQRSQGTYWPVMCGLPITDHPSTTAHEKGSDFLRMVSRLSARLTEISAQFPDAVRIRGVLLRSKERCDGGSFADIYQGYFGGIVVAVKKLRASQYQSKSSFIKTARALGREASIWKNLDHSNVLPFFGVANDISEFPGSVCMVVLWAKYGSISKYIESHTVNDPEVYSWLSQSARGLAYLHRENIVHGDLRAANILLDSERRARLADFGLSDFADATSASGSPTRHGLPTWPAPEMIDPERFGMGSTRPTRQSDIFDFSALCWELHNGQTPFRERSTLQAILAVSSGERPSRSVSKRRIASVIWELMQRCWRQDPRHRPSANEAAIALAPPALPQSSSTEEDAAERRRKIYKSPTLPSYPATSGAKYPVQPRRHATMNALQTTAADGHSGIHLGRYGCSCSISTRDAKCALHRGAVEASDRSPFPL